MARGSLTDLLADAFTTVLFGKKDTARLPVRTSSNQAEAIYLPTAAPGLGDSGVIIGREVYSGKGYIYDPFQLYGQQLPAPHWLVLGESGNGKSSLEKTYVLRQLRFKDRQVVVLDAQGEDGVGEWNRIAEAVGVTPIRLDPHHRSGSGIRLNPLDPAITMTGQLALLRTIIEVALGHPLDERSGYALKAAHAAVRAEALREGRQPILHDVVEALRDPKLSAAEEMNVALDEVRDWGLDVALVLDRLVDGDLANMFDGPTSIGIDLDSPLIVFDLSTIDRNSIAMPILMAIVGVWLEHTWIKPDRKKRIFLVEEAWHIINSPSVAQLFQRLLKFGRRLGLSFVAVVHHLSDVVDGAAAKEAAAILKMASTRTIYMQKSDEARATGRVLGLPRWAVEIIPTLSPGIAVWDVNGDVQVVKHIVTEIERPLVYTDRAMTESSGILDADVVDDDFLADDELPFAFAEAEALQSAQQDGRIGGFGGNIGTGADAAGGAEAGAVVGSGARTLRAGRSADAAALPPAGPRALRHVPPNEAAAGTRLPAHRAVRPEQEDPDLTAIAAAVFGPRASTPSHAQAQAQARGQARRQAEAPGHVQGHVQGSAPEHTPERPL